MELAFIIFFVMLGTGVLTWLFTYLYMSSRRCPKPKKVSNEPTPEQLAYQRACSEAKFERDFKDMLAYFEKPEHKEKLLWAKEAFRTMWYIAIGKRLEEENRYLRSLSGKW